MSAWQMLFLVAMGCGTGLLGALAWIFDDDIPMPLSQLRQELLTVRTMVRIRRISSTTLNAMLAEAHRQWQARR